MNNHNRREKERGVFKYWQFNNEHAYSSGTGYRPVMTYGVVPGIDEQPRLDHGFEDRDADPKLFRGFCILKELHNLKPQLSEH